MAEGCCTPLKGIARKCGGAIGGIKYFGAICKNEVIEVTFDKTTPCLITGITLVEGSSFKSFPIEPDSSNLDIPSFRGEGAKGFTSTVTAVFTYMNAERNCELQKFMSDSAVVLIKDNENTWWLLGYDDPDSDFGMIWTDGNTAGTGTTRTDRNGYTLVLEEITGHYPYEITEDAVKKPGSGGTVNALGHTVASSSKTSTTTTKQTAKN